MSPSDRQRTAEILRSACGRLRMTASEDAGRRTQDAAVAHVPPYHSYPMSDQYPPFRSAMNTTRVRYFAFL